MKVVHIFEVPYTNRKLFAAQLEGEDVDEFGNQKDAFINLKDQWTDVKFLREFFLTHQKDYYNFYGSSTLLKKINETRRLAIQLLLDVGKSCEDPSGKSLNDLFKPLDDREIEENQYHLQALKAKGEERKSYLRIYAIRFNHEFVITGGAIKLIDKMEKRPYLQKELDKMYVVQEYLKKEGIEGDFVYLNV